MPAPPDPMYTPWAKSGRGAGHGYCTNESKRKQCSRHQLGFLLFLSSAVIQQANVSTRSNGTPERVRDTLQNPPALRCWIAASTAILQKCVRSFG